MSSILGLWHRGGRPVDPLVLGDMRAALAHWKPDASALWQDGPVSLGHLALHDTPESIGEVLPLHDAASGMTLTADVRLDNRQALAEALGIDGAVARDLPDSALVLRAYQRWGEDCVAHLLGDFAFALWDAPRRTLFCARDHVGIRPFYYAEGRTFAFATELKGILAVPEVDDRIDEQWVLDTMLFIRPDRTGTFYRGIRRLEAGHTLTVSEDESRIRRYWQLDPSRELRLPSEGEYVEAFRERLDDAIRARTRTAFPVGSELSGGLDSSGVTAIVHRLLTDEGRALTTFSDVLPLGAEPAHPAMTDERAFIEALNEHIGLEDAVFVTGEDEPLLDTVDWAARHLDQPPKKHLNLYLVPLFRAAQERGVRALFSGFGGDDMVTFRGEGYVEDRMRRGDWRGLWAETRAEGLPPWRAARSLATTALREVLPDFDGVGFPYVGSVRKRRDIFLQRVGRHRFRPEAVDEEALRRRYVQHRLTRVRGTMNERIARLFIHPHILTHRLDNAALVASAFRVSYRYPLLDVPLMEFYLSLPTELKRSPRWGRYAFRLAMEGVLPESIRWREDKSGSSCPSAIYRLHRDGPALLDAFRQLPRDGGLGRFVDLDYAMAHQEDVLRRGALNEITTFKLLLIDRIVRQAERDGALLTT